MSTLIKEQTDIQNEIHEKEKAIHSYMNDKVVGSFTKKEIDVLKTTIAAGTNKEEFSLFIQTCVSSGLNPFLNHIHPVIYNPNDPNRRRMNIQISVEGIMSLARKREGFSGVDVQLVGENDEFKVARVEGYMKIIKHEIGFPRGQIVGGYAIARRTGFPDVLVLMEAHEVEHLKRGPNGHMWNNYFTDMFKKHILKRAAKEQYGIELAEEEAIQAPQDPFEAPTPQVLQETVQSVNEVEAPKMPTVQDMWLDITDISNEKGMTQMQIDQIIKDRFNGMAREDFEMSHLAALKKFVQITPVETIKQHEEPEEIDELDQFALVFE